MFGLFQQTRIGRNINELRKKTQDRDLAKRAKNLVRSWQQLLTIHRPTADSAVINGEGTSSVTGHPGGSAGAPSGIPSRLLNQKSPAFGSKPSSPCSRPGTPSSFKSCTSPALPYNSAQSTPTHNWRPRTPSNSSQSKLSPILGRTCSPLARTPSPALVSAKVGSCSGPGRQSPGLPLRATSTPVSSHRPGTPVYNHNRSSPKLPPSQLTHAASTPALSEKPRTPYMQSFTPSRLASPSQARSSSTLTTPDLSKTNVVNKKKRHFELDACGSHNSNKKVITSKETNASSHSTTLKSHAPVNGLVAHSSLKDSNSSLNNHCAANAKPSVTSRISTPSNGASSGLDTSSRFTKSATMSDLQTRTPKVKTTAELIQQMHNSGKLHLARSETVTKIALNQIEKESDCDQSVVPPEAKPRPRRKPGTAILPHTSSKSLSQTKTELVQKFLQTSITPTLSEPDLSTLFKLDSPCTPNSPHNGSNFNCTSDRPLGGVRWDIESTGSDERNSKPTDPWSLLPPLNLDEINWDEDEYVVSERHPVCDADVDRLHTDHWPGVNGQYGHDQQWYDWQQAYSLPSYDDSLLHILPYVDIEYGDMDDA